MTRKEESYILLGLVIAALSCVAGWLALPQLQPWLDAQLKNPLFLPLVGLALLLLVALPLLRWDWVLSRVRALIPQQRLETRYLEAVERSLRRTPALLVISERSETHTELDLLAAYSALTLGPDPEQPDLPLADTSAPERGGGLFGLARGKGADGRHPRNHWYRPLSWLISQIFLLGVALLFLRGLLWATDGSFQFGWGSGIASVFVLLVWFGLAALLHKLALPRLCTYLDQRGDCSAPAGTPGAEIWAHPRLLIMGDPGSGKTTLLRHIAVLCAQERLKRPGRTRLRDAYGWPDHPLPIYIPLRALRDAAVSGNCPLLESYAQTLREVELLGAVVRAIPDDYFQRRAEAGGCMILIDAFDELRNVDARKRLGKLVLSLPPGPAHAPNRIVVTSRIEGYEGQLRGQGFMHRRLADLDENQAAAFIRQRYRALASLGVRASGEPTGVTWDPEVRASRLISRLPDNPGLRKLRRNPFLLSLMISVHLKSPRELPRQRHALYRRAMDMLVEEWERWKDQEIGLLPTTPAADLDADQKLRPKRSGGSWRHDRTPAADLDADQKLRLLYELAWAMYERSVTASDDQRTVITRKEAVQILAGTLSKMPTITAGRADAELDAFCRSEATDWLSNLSLRGGVLQELGNVADSNDEAKIQFAHQTFQEYLASQSIDASPPEIQKLRISRLREQWDDENWREVLLLYSATTTDASPMMRHLLNQHTTSADLLAGALLAEKPTRMDREPLEEALRRLRQRSLAAGEATPALAALQTLAETGLEPVDRALARAALNAPHLAVRERAIELLAGMQHNRPAPAPLTPHIEQLMLHLLASEQGSRLRIAAGFALARHDPRYDSDNLLPEMIHIPAGPFLMGSSDTDKDSQKEEKPQQTLNLPDYWIAKNPVTNAEWQRFIAAGGYRTRRYWSRAGWRWLRCGWEPAGNYSTPQALALIFLGPLFDPLVGLLLRRRPFAQPHPESWDDPAWNGANQPVTGISFYEAEAYCRWLSKTTQHPFHLPSEAEWEKAARGPDGRVYPWGNSWAPGRCNSREAGIGKPTPVGSYPQGAGFYGNLDLVGNVWEWCATRWKNNYPGRKADWEDRFYNLLAQLFNVYGIRGGAYNFDQKYVRGAYRHYNDARYRLIFIGLRVASRSPMPGSVS